MWENRGETTNHHSSLTLQTLHHRQTGGECLSVFVNTDYTNYRIRVSQFSIVGESRRGRPSTHCAYTSLLAQSQYASNVTHLREHSDNILWLKINVNNAENPLAIDRVYLSPENSVHNCEKEDFFNEK